LETQEECGAAAGCRLKGAFRFERKEHLKGRKEIRAVFNEGKRFGCRGAKLFVLKNSLIHNRICFTFSRGFGNSAERNRARRLSREAYRLMRPRLRGGCDLVLMVFPETSTPSAPMSKTARTLAARTGQLEFLFSKAGLFK
jgi:ribonuclease P protein component